MDTVRSVPGVTGAAASMGLPGLPTQYQIEVSTARRPGGNGTQDDGSEPRGHSQLLRHYAHPTVGRRDVPGRWQYSVAMVNRSFADAYLGGSAAIGRHVMQPGNPLWGRPEIRGIVGDARESGMDREPPPTVYWCYSALQPGTYFLVRTHGDPQAMAETIRRKIHEIEPRRSVYDLTPLAEHISDAYAENRLRTMLLAFFAITAVSLACMGLYGTLSYLVNVRQREVGLRLALGALRTQIVGQFLAQGLTVSLLGCVAGLALSVVSGRLLSGMLYGVSRVGCSDAGQRSGYRAGGLGRGVVVTGHSRGAAGTDAGAEGTVNLAAAFEPRYADFNDFNAPLTPATQNVTFQKSRPYLSGGRNEQRINTQTAA